MLSQLCYLNLGLYLTIFLQDCVKQTLMIFEHSIVHFMLLASLNPGDFANLSNSTGNLSLVTLNIFFILLGDRASVWCMYFLYEQLPIGSQKRIRQTAL